jgi:hypothetical protein
MSPFDYSKHEAIPTRIEDIDFRSRLEARWAVFLASAGYDFRYEFKTFKGPGFYYTPDFWVNVDGNLLILEIKPAGYVSSEWDRFKWRWMHSTLKENVATNAEFAVIYGMPYLERHYSSWAKTKWGDFVWWRQSLPEAIAVTRYRSQYREAAKYVFKD